MNNLIKPSFMLHSDKPAKLRADYLAQMRAINSAKDTLAMFPPHQRNYLHFGEHKIAMANHVEQLKNLEEIYNNLELACIHCDNSIPKREYTREN